MHIQKFLVIAFVTALSAGSLHAQRPDSDIQAKARDQLRQAMEQLDAQPPVAVPNAEAPSPKKSKKEKALAKPAVVAVPETPKVAAPPAMVVTPAPVVVRSPAVLSPAEEAKVRESMRKAIEEMDAKGRAETAAQESKPKVVPLVEKPVAPVKPTPTMMIAEPSSKPKVKVVEGPATGVALSTAPAPVAKAKPIVKVSEGTTFSPAVGAAAAGTPAPSSKDQRLLDLLQAYKYDKITPTEYHSQRAKILAEP